MRRAGRLCLVLLGGSLGQGCAAAPAAPGAQPNRTPANDLVPAGHGTLRQEEVTLTLRSGPLLLKVTPLEEWVIRLTAQDTYRRLSELAVQHRAAIEERTGTPAATLFLVSFFSEQPDVTFAPQDLQLVNRGRLHRPQLVRGITTGWGTERLSQRETQMAVYAFEPGIDLSLDLTVEYGDARSAEWSRVLQLLQAEAGRARARAGVAPGS